MIQIKVFLRILKIWKKLNSNAIGSEDERFPVHPTMEKLPYQEEEDPQLRQGVLDLFRSKSTYETSKQGESSAFNSKSNQKPDLRKKKSIGLNFRDDPNFDAINTFSI